MKDVAIRHRQPRVPCSIPVELSWKANDRRIKVRGETETVSAAGALLRIHSRAVPPRLSLKNAHTGLCADATVLYTMGFAGDGRLTLAVALDTPCEEFWGVHFP